MAYKIIKLTQVVFRGILVRLVHRDVQGYHVCLVDHLDREVLAGSNL